jgi:multiple sugar transport system ATP-binding protein
MNFMQGRLIKENGRVYFDEGRIKVKLTEEMAKRLNSHLTKEVIFGIRPEDIYDKLFVTQAGPENIVRVKCEVFEPMGSEVYLYLNTGRHAFVARVGAHDQPPVNQDMDVVFDMSKVHFFDKDAQNTIV